MTEKSQISYVCVKIIKQSQGSIILNSAQGREFKKKEKKKKKREGKRGEKEGKKKEKRKGKRKVKKGRK